MNVMDLDKEDRLKLRKKWSRGVDNTSKTPRYGSSVRFDTSKSYPASPFPELLNRVPLTPEELTTLHCAFCGDKVEKTCATFGKKAGKKIIETLHEVDGEIEIETTVQHYQTQVVACPNCVLSIKPSVAREPCPSCGGVDSQGCRGCKGKSFVEGRVTSNINFPSLEDL